MGGCARPGGQDFGDPWLRRGGARRRPPEQAGYRRRHGAAVDRPRRRGRDRRRADSPVALAVNTVCRGEGPGLLSIPAAPPPTSPGAQCSPTTVHWTYDTWMLSQLHRRGDGEGRRRQLVLHHRRLRVRPAARARHRQPGEGGGGKVLGEVHYPFPDTTDFSALLVQAQSSGRRCWASPMPAATPVNCIKQAPSSGSNQR